MNDMAGTRLTELMEQARDVDGIDAVAVIDRDGMLLAASTAEEMDNESVGAAAASGLLVADALGAELSRGGSTQVTVEYGEGMVLLTPLDEDLALVIVASAMANLGRLRLLARRSRGDLLAAAKEFVVLPGTHTGADTGTGMGMGTGTGTGRGANTGTTSTGTGNTGVG